jgi:hypothetical protein
LKKAESSREEGPSCRLAGRWGSYHRGGGHHVLVHLYAVVGIIMTQILRGIHVMFVLFLVFLVFPPQGFRTGSSGMITAPWGSPSVYVF